MASMTDHYATSSRALGRKGTISNQLHKMLVPFISDSASVHRKVARDHLQDVFGLFRHQAKKEERYIYHVIFRLSNQK